MKIRWFFMIAVVFVFVSTALPVAAEGGKSVDVRVMTYNIQAGMGADGQYDSDHIADIIKESQAEVVALQEVDVHWGARSQFENVVDRLADQLDMNYTFAPIYDNPPLEENGPRQQFGVAIMSKYPILKETNQEITRLSTQDASLEHKLTPGFAEAIINVQGSLIPFYSTHLDYRGDPHIREMQVDDMLQIFEEQPGSKVLMGDMNASPEANELRPLLEKFTDVWNTVNTTPGYTYPSLSPNNRIDHIYASDDIEVLDAHLIQSEASDHLPVIADLSVERGNNGQILKGSD
ncbi:endonuclease/exonuclease/phosphatase family protein [Halobacillus sp. A5]|uniref:endonuclease/exonuclease/phosphatase family protein n=1 Tax=Halobacillus sp. A5 TaxID=2880263 RepID=UPI0020A6B683|nr:endonuclease/exonuclease/phosphatase family protein [Halobacillus sp. A5]MCP3026494.1 endonuclease/exonuclease/phosphatase family protein [Halobacillus sp. A5]